MDPNLANPITSTEHIRAILTLLPSVTDGLHATSAKTREAIEGLPYIQEDELIALGEKDNACPICIVPFLALLAEEEMARAMDSPAHPVEELGVTRLVGDGRCGHVFCRKDLSKWILSGKNTCPLCRQPLFKAEANTNTDTNTNANTNTTAGTDADDADELTDFRAQFDRHMQELMRQHQAQAEAPSPAPAPSQAAGDGTSTTPSAQADTSANELSNSNPNASAAAAAGRSSSTRATGGIARDLGEGHAPDQDRDEDEGEDELASMMAGMNPEDAQRMRATMAAMQSMFSMGGMFAAGPAGQRQREERDDDRDEYSGMYS